MIASVLQEAGYRTGLYTSPHLKDFRERIRVNGEMIPKAEVIAFVKNHKGIIESVKPSFFEMTVAMALIISGRAMLILQLLRLVWEEGSIQQILLIQFFQ